MTKREYPLAQEVLVSKPESAAATPGSRARRERRPGGTVVVVVPILLVLITFLFWYQTWFGRRLTDRDMDQYLADTSAPHKTQHVLSQLAERMARGDLAARRWYPQVLGLAGSKEAQFRLMAAWVMGQDNQSQEFHQALRKLVTDPEPLVRWNAALALSRFGDASGEPQLRLMLRPYILTAPLAGAVDFRLKENEAVKSGRIVARIRTGDGRQSLEVRSPLTGQVERFVVKDGARVAAGDDLAILSPAEEQVWESLRGLYLVGKPDDLGDVERFARGGTGLSDRVRQQAITTLQAIRLRAAGNVTSDK